MENLLQRLIERADEVIQHVSSINEDTQMQDEQVSFGRQSTIAKVKNDISVVSRGGRDQQDMIIMDLKLHYEEKLEQLKQDLAKERSKNKKYQNFITQRTMGGAN